MAGIWNINSAYNVNSKRIHKKLSFEVGEKFKARIINFNKSDSEAILKLLDGWQFSAHIKESINFTPKGLIGFEVEGYEDGKLLLKLINDENESETKNLLGDTLEKQGIKVEKEDYPLLEKMIKYKMPLTKDNISKVKTLLDFKDKILQDTSEEESFILRYVNNKGIDINSQKGQNIRNTLKGFFKEFKKLSTEELFTLIDNNIELTEDNIKSFNKIVKDSMSLYKEVTDLEKGLSNKVNRESNFKEFQEPIKEESVLNKDKNMEEAKSSEGNSIKNTEKSGVSKNNTYIQKAYDINNSKEVDGKEILKQLLGIDSSEEENTKLNTEKLNGDKLDVEKSADTNSTKEEVAIGKESNKDIDNNLQKSSNIKKEVETLKLQNEDIDTSKKVKEQISDKTNEMKNLIRQAAEENSSLKNDSFSKIVQTLQNKMNDFKVFNSISNQYYYLDVPINVSEKEYPCKLIVKDERKKGKKIDSSNVKFVASVKTINMGIVDAYIKVLNRNISIDIKCEKSWIKVLDLGKERIIKKLNDMGYMTNVDVKEKIIEANIVECREFFEDNDFTSINMKV
ncbi:hypothetical protein [Clostridium ganghwense]|uniref:Rhoptry protein n=1 Tax=Clostridium ganghwense TaxID=312089 RepID=A0ABT4CKJ5_9CLOT|nr:hypothetical protein [Clostridium ganghwense]MCY6369570.1 hypothetical protein [Clostridium ganghwense]